MSNQVEFKEELNRKPLLIDTFSPDQIEKFLMGEATLGQLYGITMEEAYSIAEIGYNFLEHGKYRQAQSIFEGLVLCNPLDGYFHTLLAAVYQKLDLLDAAIKEYTLALALDPTDIQAWVNRGEVLMQKGEFEFAAIDFKKAIELDPERKNKSANRARALAAATYAAIKQIA